MRDMEIRLEKDAAIDPLVKLSISHPLPHASNLTDINSNRPRPKTVGV